MTNWVSSCSDLIIMRHQNLRLFSLKNKLVCLKIKQNVLSIISVQSRLLLFETSDSTALMQLER